MESVAVAVSAVSALSELRISRDDELNEKAYLRAMMKQSSVTDCLVDTYTFATFKPPQDISTHRITEERLSRERILQMQNDISRDLCK